MVLDDQSAMTARATMSAAALGQFASGRVDVWIETSWTMKVAAFGSDVGVSPLSRPKRTVENYAPGARWYATVNGT